MDKNRIRKNIKALKSTLSNEKKKDAAMRVFSRLETANEFISAGNVLIYHSLPDELSTIEFIDKWRDRKNMFLPRVNGENLDIVPLDNNLRTGAFNIKEPSGDSITDIGTIDLIIVPAIAFDRNGNRIGRGKGYYDRLLKSANRITKIGIGYGFQIVDEIDCEPHDIAVDIVITDNDYITIANNH